MSSALFQVEGISKRFGGLQALRKVSLTANEQEILAVIGPNGAGKTTFFNCLSGIYTPEQGTIRLAGQNLSGLLPHQISRCGLSRSFQNIRLFPEMTCLQNVLAGRFSRMESMAWGALFRTSAWKQCELQNSQKASDLLELTGLSQHANTWARNLPYGLQRKLEVARALATEPKVLLLDEPAAGMNPGETIEMMHLVSKIRSTGVTVILIEHHMQLVMEISDRILVLDHGEPIAEGTPQAIRENPAVIAAYLGGEAA